VTEPLGGVPHHGPLQERWPTTGRTHDDGARTVSKGGEAQAAESVGDELEIRKANGFTKGKAIACKCSPPEAATNADDGTIETPGGKSTLQIPLPVIPDFYAKTKYSSYVCLGLIVPHILTHSVHR
jgi:hypothetical protein